MKKISFINGSPNGNKAFSFSLLKKLDDIIEGEKCFVNVNFKGKYNEETFESLVSSDVIVIAFPLYYYCVPGMLLNFLQQYYEYSINKKGKSAKVYIIINCGFPEPQINDEAINVIRSFSSKVGLNFRFAVSIGGGGFTNATKNMPISSRSMKNISGALEQIKADICEGTDKDPCEDIMIKPALPKWLVMFIVSKSWYFASKKNGLSKKDLYRRPYVEK